MTSTVQWVTLGAAVYAAFGTTAAAVVTTTRARRLSAETWERDGVTAAYQALHAAMNDVIRCANDVLAPMFSTEPIGDVEAGRALLRARNLDFLAAFTATAVVARPAVASMALEIAELDISPLAPVTTSGGVTGIALERFQQLRRYLYEVYGDLTLAMRVDFGLADRAARKSWATRSRPQWEWLSSSDSLEDLRQTLVLFGVDPLGGAAADYRIDGTQLSRFQLQMQAIRRPLAGILVSNEQAISFGIADDLGPDEELKTLQAAVFAVETGLERTPFWRSGPDGSRVFVWDRAQASPAPLSP